jgi:hypothetical protein
MSREDFEGESGRLTDYEAYVEDAFFANNPESSFDKRAVNINLVMITDSPELPQFTERYKTGPDWQTFDGGKTVEHPKDKKKFNRQTQYQKFIDAALGCMDQDQIGELVAKGGPREAAIWIGSKWFMSEVTESFTIQQGEDAGQTRTMSKNFPSKFLGWGDLPTQDSTGQSNGLLDSLDTDMVESLRQLAQGPHNLFMDGALEVPGVAANSQLVIALADEGPGSIYLTLKG